MRIAAISDMHANAVAFEAVIADLRRQSPDLIVCLGDVAMRGPQPKECVGLLQSLNPLVTVRGNYDWMFTRFPTPDWRPNGFKDELKVRDFAFTTGRLSEAEQAWLANLPLEYRTTIEGVQMELYHAGPGSLGRYTWPWASLEELQTLRADEGTSLVLFGHMHHSFVRSAKGFTVVNTGSVGLSFDGDNRASYAIIDLAGGDLAVQIRRVAYDVERAIRVGRDVGMPDLDHFAYALRHAAFPYDGPVPPQ